jgi:hypothetical protein
MGMLKYDGMSVDFDDRLLAHLQTVVVQKMRRQESFLMSWQDSDDLGGGRTGIWIHQFAHITFHFSTNSDPKVDRACRRERRPGTSHRDEPGLRRTRAPSRRRGTGCMNRDDGSNARALPVTRSGTRWASSSTALRACRSTSKTGLSRTSIS